MKPFASWLKHSALFCGILGSSALAGSDVLPYADSVNEAHRRHEVRLRQGGETRPLTDTAAILKERGCENAVYPLLYSPRKRMNGTLADWNDIPYAGNVRFSVMSHTEPPPGLRVSFKAAVSGDTLYILAVAKDANLNFGFQPAYKGDCFELFLDPFFQRETRADDSSIQLFVSADDKAGRQLSAKGKIPAEVKPVPVEGGWGAEIAIPLDNDYFHMRPFDGLAFGFNFSYNNNDNGKSRTHKLTWSGLDRDDTSWLNPSLYGVFEVVRADAGTIAAVKPGKAIEENRRQRSSGETLADPSVIAKFRPTPAIVRGFQVGGLGPNGESFSDMKKRGANVTRLQLQSLGPYPTWTKENYPVFLDRLETAVKQARAAGIKVVPTAFEVPGGVDREKIWNKPEVEAGFRQYWRGIVERLKPYQDTIWAYDIYNEPVERARLPYAPEKWRQMAIGILREIRKVDPRAWIIYEVGPGGGWRGFEGLKPLPDPRVIYSFHFYEPGAFTHQGITASQLQDPGLLAKAQEATGIRYPGLIGGIHWDRNHMEKSLQLVIDFQKKYDAPIFVGEFSAVAWAPVESSTQYLKDVTGLFQKYGWSWTYHAFREWPGWSLEHEDGVLKPAIKLKKVSESARGKVIDDALKANVQP